MCSTFIYGPCSDTILISLITLTKGRNFFPFFDDILRCIWLHCWEPITTTALPTRLSDPASGKFEQTPWNIIIICQQRLMVISSSFNVQDNKPALVRYPTRGAIWSGCMRECIVGKPMNKGISLRTVNAFNISSGLVNNGQHYSAEGSSQWLIHTTRSRSLLSQLSGQSHWQECYTSGLR